ncbi:NAC domain [Carpediemonas membranifera]|uniref:Nascent polypeptide-associated complex subunit beta n=1 Tax=Carpediemonas membranifera TaxID=201153 RepID=A0A8J6BAQ0_9EUKA|nr:NAC domain [Carpediemonas membranifera]|eukprot:KAG9396794.1 NAC domain [Carpediemonas membranifera]
MVVDRSKLPARAAARVGGQRRTASHSHGAHVDVSAIKSASKKSQLQAVPGFDEVQIYLNENENGDVIKIQKPEINANIKSNTFVVSGGHQDRRPIGEFWQDLIGNTITPEQLQKLAELQKDMKAQETAEEKQ